MKRLWGRVGRSLRVRAARVLGLVPDEVELPALRQEDLVSLREHFPRPKFFLIGYPRSGTTLLARLLRLHPEVHCNWQGHFASGSEDWISRLARPEVLDWLSRPSNRWSEGEALAPAVIRASADWMMERAAGAHGAHWVGDKTPTARGGEAVARLALVYPDAHLIAIVRDGRDASLSQRIQAFIDQPETLPLADLRIRSELAGSPAAFGEGGRSLFTTNWLQRVADDWMHTVTEGHRLAQERFGERYQAVRFEDLVDKPWELLELLWRFLEVQTVPSHLQERVSETMKRNPAADWHEEQAPELVASLKRGTAGGWRDWFTREDRALFRDRAGAGLRAWDYPVE